MPRRNLLRIVRNLDKSSAETYEPIDFWDAWVCHGDKENVDDWVQEEEGTLDECIQALTNWISVEVDMELRSIHIPDEKFLSEWERRQNQRRKEIRQQCLTKGRVDSVGSQISPPWTICRG